MDVARSFIRGAVRVHLLHHAAEGEIHGVEMIEELSRHGHRLSPGTLYPMLHRMEAAGLLVSRTVVSGGHARRLYRATPEGRLELEQCRVALAELADEVGGR
jgi:DNA-binding PadR family transcriptional regulator